MRCIYRSHAFAWQLVEEVFATCAKINHMKQLIGTRNDSQILADTEATKCKACIIITVDRLHHRSVCLGTHFIRGYY